MRVLLAIDGSPDTDVAVAEVARRRWPYGTVVQILTVIHSPVPAMIDRALMLAAVQVAELEAQRHHVSTFLKKAADRIVGGAAAVVVTTKTLEGSPNVVIVEEAREWGADLVVVGAHGYGRVRRMVLGSVAGAVVAHAPCSVQVVRDRYAFDDPETAA